MWSMSTQALLALSNSTSTIGNTEFIPLIPTSPDFDTTESLNSSPPSTSLIDIVMSTLAMVVATLRSGSQSVKPQSLVEDTISRCPLDTLRGMKWYKNLNQLSFLYSMSPCWQKWSTITPPSTACLTTSVTCSLASCSMLVMSTFPSMHSPPLEIWKMYNGPGDTLLIPYQKEGGAMGREFSYLRQSHTCEYICIVGIKRTSEWIWCMGVSTWAKVTLDDGMWWYRQEEKHVKVVERAW